VRQLPLALALAFFGGGLHAGDWPMFKGSPQRQGSDAQALGLPISLAWKQDQGGAFYSSPAIVKGRIYIGNVDHHVYCYDLQSGNPIWKAELPERIYGSSPQVEGGGVSIACVDGCVYTLDAASGAIQSKLCLKKGRAFSDGPDILGSPLLDGGSAYFGSDDHFIYCFKGGAESWAFETGGKVHDAAPALWQNLVFMACSDGRLYALDKDSGKLAWKTPPFDKLNTTPLVLGGRLYFGAGDGKLRCLDAKSGALAWSFDAPKGVMSSPSASADGSALVFGGADGNVYCLAPADGSLKWKFKTGGPVLASPLLTAGLAWIGSFDKNFYTLGMDDGKALFSFKTGSGIFSSAAPADAKVVVGGRDGVLYCFAATLK
jgi:outer membrane protein assembly factor BamB